MGGINLNIKNPTTEVFQQDLPASSYTGTLLMHFVNVLIPFNTTSTASANMAWINPEAGTVLARAQFVWRTGGTGTINAARGDDGTGSGNNLIAGGTMVAGVLTRATTGSALAGTAGEAGGWFLVGPGGTGTNNSINAQVGDTITSTATGGMVVTYTRVL